MDSKTIATNDLYEMAVYTCAGVEPAQVQSYTDRHGNKMAMAVYVREGLPKKESFRVIWEEEDGSVHSTPLLSGVSMGSNFVSNFINNKRKMFEFVDNEKGE
jgi:hypothetical protein